MARYHTTDEGNIPFTAAEEAEQDIKDAATLAAKPMKDWQASMAATDADMPRYVEDILDMIGTTGLNSVTANRYNAKKALRATKPGQ